MRKVEFLDARSMREEALRLHIADTQKGTIETVEECLKEADELSLWKPIIIRVDNENIGFAMYGLWKYEGNHGRVWLDRFFIDEHAQGKGLAKFVLPILIRKIFDDYKMDEIFLSVYDTNKPAISLYEKLGFKFNGEFDINKELVMVKKDDLK